VWALRGLPLHGRLLIVPVSHKFLNSLYINTTLYPAFLRKFLSTSSLCTPSNTNFLTAALHEAQRAGKYIQFT